jgi:hypothetical protein
MKTFFRSARIRKLEIRLAGLRAKLNATQRIVDLCAKDVPGAIVADIQTLPQQIAETEARLRQLGVKNENL